MNKLKKTNVFFLDLMLIELPDEHILGYCPGPRGSGSVLDHTEMASGISLPWERHSRDQGASCSPV